MKKFHVAALATALSLSGAFTSVAAQQGPPGEEERRGPAQPPGQRPEQDKPGEESRQRPQPQSRPDSPRQSQEAPAPQQRPGNVRAGNDRPGNDRPGDDNGRGRQGPPSDFGEARRIIQQNRHSIGRGAPVANRVRIVKGERLPSGWGKRLTREQLRPLPTYPGYEWRRLGSDMILIEVQTLIVYEILSGVLD